MESYNSEAQCFKSYNCKFLSGFKHAASTNPLAAVRVRTLLASKKNKITKKERVVRQAKRRNKAKGCQHVREATCNLHDSIVPRACSRSRRQMSWGGATQATGYYTPRMSRHHAAMGGAPPFARSNPRGPTSESGTLCSNPFDLALNYLGSKPNAILTCFPVMGAVRVCLSGPSSASLAVGVAVGPPFPTLATSSSASLSSAPT